MVSIQQQKSLSAASATKKTTTSTTTNTNGSSNGIKKTNTKTTTPSTTSTTTTSTPSSNTTSSNTTLNSATKTKFVNRISEKQIIEHEEGLTVEEIETSMKKKDSIVQCFYDVISTDEATRIQGIETLITTLEELQSTFKPQHHQDVTRYIPIVINKTKIYNQSFSPELNYALKRLVTGLSSSRDASRIGLSLALGELLNALPIIPLQWVFDFIMSSMDINGSSHLPERDAIYGRLFGMMAIIKSGRIDESYKITQEPVNSYIYNSSRPSSEFIVEALFDQIIFITRKKVTFTELAYETLLSLIGVLGESNLPKIWNYLKVLIPETLTIDQYSPEILSLLLYLSNNYKTFDVTKLLIGWNHSSILNIENLNLLKKPYSDTSKSHPRVHKLWKQTISILHSNNPNNCSLVEFWKIMIEDTILKSSSTVKKYLGLQLFQMVLPVVPIDFIGELFTVKLIYYLNESLRADSALYEIGSQVFQGIAKLAEKSPQHRYALIIFFATKYRQFIDIKIPMDLISELIKEVNGTEFKQYVKYIVDSFYNTDGECEIVKQQQQQQQLNTSEEIFSDTEESEESIMEKAITAHRHWLSTLLVILFKESLKRNISIVKEIESQLLEILQFFYFNAFYLPIDNSTASTSTTKTKKKSTTKSTSTSTLTLSQEELISRVPNHPLSESTKTLCSQKFYTLLEEVSVVNISYLLAVEKDPSISNPEEYIEGTMTNGQYWSLELVKFQNTLANRTTDKPNLSTLLPMGFKPIERLMKLLFTLVESKSKASKQSRGFELLFTHVALQFILEPIETADLVDDLCSSYENLIKGSKPTTTATPNKKQSAQQQQQQPTPFMVLLDIFVSLMGRQSTIMKTIVKQLFGIFSEFIQLPVFEHLLSIITSPVTSLFDGLDDENMGHSGDEMDSDIEIVSGDEDDNMDEKDDDDEDEEENDDGSNDDDSDLDDSELEIESESDDEVDPELVARLKKQLAGHLLFEDDDEDEQVDEDGGSIPTDEQAKQMDTQLSAIFHHRKEKKYNFDDIKSKSTNLKLRLLELIDGYIKRYSTKPNQVVFELILLLVDAKVSDEPTISSKFSSLFKQRIPQIKPTNQDMESLLSGKDKPMITFITKTFNQLFDKLISSGKNTSSSTSSNSTLNQKEREQKAFQSMMCSYSLHTIISNILLLIKGFDKSIIQKRVAELADKKSFSDRRNTIAMNFISEFSNRCPDLLWEHVPRLLGYIKEGGINEYCHQKIMELIVELSRKKQSANNQQNITNYLSQIFNAATIYFTPNDKHQCRSSSVTITLSTIYTLLSNATTTSEIKKLLTADQIKAFDSSISAICKKSGSQQHKEIAKRILKLLEVQDSPLLELSKRKRKQLEHSKKSTTTTNASEAKKPGENGEILTIHNARKSTPEEKALARRIKADNIQKNLLKNLKGTDQGAIMTEDEEQAFKQQQQQQQNKKIAVGSDEAMNSYVESQEEILIQKRKQEEKIMQSKYRNQSNNNKKTNDKQPTNQPLKKQKTNK